MIKLLVPTQMVEIQHVHLRHHIITEYLLVYKKTNAYSMSGCNKFSLLTLCCRISVKQVLNTESGVMYEILWEF